MMWPFGTKPARKPERKPEPQVDAWRVVRFTRAQLAAMAFDVVGRLPERQKDRDISMSGCWTWGDDGPRLDVRWGHLTDAENMPPAPAKPNPDSP